MLPSDSKLLGLLKGLGMNEAQAQQLAEKGKVIGEANRERERQQANLDAKKAEIVASLSEVVKVIPNFTVEVKDGVVQVRLGGVSTTGRAYTPPAGTPIKDAGGARHIVAQWGTQSDKDEFAKADKDKDGTKKWQIATRVYKANQTAILAPKI